MSDLDPRALWTCSYGIYVVTSCYEGKANGQIANTVIQVTAEPPRIAVAINKENYTHEFITGRDKASLDIFWLRDESLEDSANLPDPHILAAEIADDLESALEQMRDILGDLEGRVGVGAAVER